MSMLRTTTADVRDAADNRRGRLIRHLGIALLLLVVLFGAVGGFGVRSTHGTARGGGYTLDVTYAAVSRAGLDTPWQVLVTHPGGFDGPITLATTVTYFDIFESQGLVPQASAETASGGSVYQTFDPPPGDVLRVAFDAYIQPGSQRGRRASTALIVHGREVARVSYRTFLLP
jgi:hypothetical protein